MQLWWGLKKDILMGHFRWQSPLKTTTMHSLEEQYRSLTRGEVRSPSESHNWHTGPLSRPPQPLFLNLGSYTYLPKAYGGCCFIYFNYMSSNNSIKTWRQGAWSILPGSWYGIVKNYWAVTDPLKIPNDSRWLHEKILIK